MRVTTLDDGIVRHILLDSPKDHNALSPDLLEQLQAALDGASSSAARVIRLGHVGPTFCSGMDLRTMVGNAPDLSPLRRVLESLSLTRQPTVATVSGHVRAGGIGIMAACDVVFVARHTDFAFKAGAVSRRPRCDAGRAAPCDPRVRDDDRPQSGHCRVCRPLGGPCALA